MKRYCTDCGSPTEYSLKKPIFCSNCGNPFEKNNQSIIQKVQLQRPTIANKPKNTPIIEPEVDYDYDNIEDADDKDIRHVPSLASLEVETNQEIKNKGVKLKDLMGTNDAQRKERNKIKGKKNSKKQILEDFAKEAGSLRRNKR